MSWAKLDDGLPNNPKVEGLSDRAFRLYVGSICYCARNLTDGALTAKAVRIVCAETAASRKHVQELHDAGLWDRASDGYLLHDYLEYNPLKADVLDERAKAKERQRRFRHGVSNGVTSGVTNPHPVPSRKDQKPLEATIESELIKAALDR